MSGALVLLKVIVSAAIIIAGAVIGIWLMIKGTQGLVWLLGNGFKGIAFLVGHTVKFICNTFSDTFRSVGAILTAMVLIPLTLLNFLFGRWRAGKHYGRALEDEIVSCGLGVYRVLIGNPMQFIGLGAITDGFERRLPDVVARAPHGAGGNVKDGKFEGYKVTGVLPSGGSGARLFLAKPRQKKLGELLASGHGDPGTVVIKAFSLNTGSTLPQIVRESRALQSARNLGLVLEHELSEKSFHYVMPYVPGDNLDTVITAMHKKSSSAGLSDPQLRVALGYVGDLLYTLDAFHNGGLWHKDIKPSNLIISDGRAHLVDLGLVTPLESAMTLTTHGTEYFRDPEMVRQAMRGVKVHEVNGVKFDLYSSGAVLYTLIENSFPAHGSLSRVTRRCPEVINWIIRRSMADLDGRYGSAQEMLADIRTVLTAKDPFAVRPADLPSVSGTSTWSIPRGTLAGKGKTRSTSFAGGSRRAETAPERSRRQREGKSQASLHRVGGTATATREYRRSTGRSLVAAFIGFLFLAGMVGFSLLGVRQSSSPEHSHIHRSRIVMPDQHEPAQAPFSNSDSYSASVHEQAQSIITKRGTILSPTTYEDPPNSTARVVSAPEQRTNGKKYRQGLVRVTRNFIDQLAEDGAHLSKDNGEGDEGAGTVLLLLDLAPTTDRGRIDALQAELERRSFKVLGNPADGIGDEQDILYVAGARKAVGVGTQNDQEAISRLQQYLEESSDLDAMIWVAEGKTRNSISVQCLRGWNHDGDQEVPAGNFSMTKSF